MIETIISPLIDTFGIFFVAGTWLFIPSIIALAASTVESENALIVGMIGVFPYLIWPFSLWILKLIYDLLPMIRVIFGTDVTDLSVFTYLALFVFGYLHEVTDDLTGAIES